MSCQDKPGGKESRGANMQREKIMKENRKKWQQELPQFLTDFLVSVTQEAGSTQFLS